MVWWLRRYVCLYVCIAAEYSLTTKAKDPRRRFTPPFCSNVFGVSSLMFQISAEENLKLLRDYFHNCIITNS